MNLTERRRWKIYLVNTENEDFNELSFAEKKMDHRTIRRESLKGGPKKESISSEKKHGFM